MISLVECDSSAKYYLIPEDVNNFHYLSGNYKLKLISGFIKINEVLLKCPLEIDIYSTALMLLSIHDGKNELTLEEIQENMSDDTIKVSINKTISKLKLQLNEKYALFSLEPLENQVIDKITKYRDFSNLSLPLKFRPNSSPTYKINDDVKNAIEIIESKSINRLLLAGMKNSGKSSLVRMLSSNLLNREESVYVMDLDPGQTEFSLSSTLSLVKIVKPLLGPPFINKITNSYQIMDQYFLGCISPAMNILHYLRSVEQLLWTFERITSDKPCHLIINTMGWTQDEGLTIMMFVIRMLKPNMIFQLRIDSKNVDYPDLTIDNVKSYNKRSSLFEKLDCNIDYDLKIIKSPIKKSLQPFLKPFLLRDLLTLTELHSQDCQSVSVKLWRKMPSQLPDLSTTKIPHVFLTELYGSTNSYPELNECVRMKYHKQVLGICKEVKHSDQSLVYRMKFPRHRQEDHLIYKCYGLCYIEKFVDIDENQGAIEVDLRTIVPPEKIHGSVLAFGSSVFQNIVYNSYKNKEMIRKFPKGVGNVPGVEKKRFFQFNKK